jgi:2',3'-cyclic-nucleotide 2'-phosphodiesterase (5'-nucleotidase family)
VFFTFGTMTPRRTHRRIAAAVAAASMASLVAVQAAPAQAAPGPTTYVLTLLHNNDGESKLLAPTTAPASNYGGAARFASLVASLKTQAATEPMPGGVDPLATRGTLMISSGDNFLAGPTFDASLNLAPGSQYYDSKLLELVGYDAVAIGNHEFDFGPGVLADFIEGIPGVPFLSANLDMSGDADLGPLVTSGRIAPYTIVTKGGEQIGIIGATTDILPSISSPGPDVIINAVGPAVQTAADTLTAMGVNKIILASHLQNIANELALVPTLRNIDIVISGGGDELLGSTATDPIIPGETPVANYPRNVNDLDGVSVPVITTAGDYRYVGRLKVGFDADGELTQVYEPESQPIRVSGLAGDPFAVTPDATVAAQVEAPVQAHVAGLQANVIAVTQVPLDGRNFNPIRRYESNLGNLIADSLLWQARQLNAGAGLPTPDVSLQNGGGIRNNSVFGAAATPGAPVNLTEFDTFSSMAFSNFVSIVPNVDPYRLRQLLEHSVAGAPTGGANTSAGGQWGHWGGIRFTWTNTGTPQVVNATTKLVTTEGTRVLDVVLADGTVIWNDGVLAPTARNVTVATIDFLANGGDNYPFGNLAKTNLGVSYQQALYNYLTSPVGLNGVVTQAAYPNLGQTVPFGNAEITANPANRRNVESTATPAPAIPEAPFVILLVLSALATAALALGVQRRRQANALTA